MNRTRMKRLWKRLVGWVTWYKSDRDVNRAWRRIYADMIRERSRLERELEAHAHDLSPAMVQARNDQLAEENTKLLARVKRLEETGDALWDAIQFDGCTIPDRARLGNNWEKAKEATP